VFRRRQQLPGGRHRPLPPITIRLDTGNHIQCQYETAVENRTQGNRFLLQFTYGLWSQ